MKSTNPKPLPQQRLNQLVYGLRERMTGSLQRTANEVQSLREEITREEESLEASLEQLERDNASLATRTTNDEDEALHATWDHAELRSYKAIYDTAAREKRLKTDAQAKIDKAKADADQKAKKIERKFLKAKDKPLNRLRNFRNANNSLKDQLQQIDSSVEASLAKRSLSTPKVDDVPAAQLPETPATSVEAFELLKTQVTETKKQADKITNNALAKFFDSIGFWMFSVVVFLATAGIVIGMQYLPFIEGIVAASIAAASFVLLGFLGVRPWLKRAITREYPVLQELIQTGNTIHAQGETLAMSENEEALRQLAEKRDSSFEQAKNWCEQTILGISNEYEATLARLKQEAADEKAAAREWLTASLQSEKDKFTTRRTANEQQFVQATSNRKSSFESTRDEINSRIEEIDRGGAHRIAVASRKAQNIVSRSAAWCDAHFPSWQKFDDSEFWPEVSDTPILPLGDLAVEAMLPSASNIQLDVNSLQTPVLFSPLADEYLVIHGSPTDPIQGKKIQQLIRSLLLRAITSLPAGRTQVCVVDPPGLGQDFGWLMHLGDVDAQLVWHRVWTQTTHINKQLSTLALAAEDTIQQALRNEYTNIVEYNRDAGALAEPFRFLVWSSMPSGLDDQGWKHLQSLLDSGARCGIIPIMVVDPDLPWPTNDQAETLERRGLHVRYDSEQGRFVASRPGQKHLEFLPPEVPGDKASQAIVNEVGRRSLLSNRVEVPLERMVPPAEERWQGDSSRSLEIPIGQSGVGRTHCLTLGVGTAQHAIIAGKTGSGKSSLLHALITSAMLKYSPEALRLVLLDFKKGVEFQTYSDAEVPHADIIGIESHREFGLSALEYVDGCMQRRGESFRAAGVQDIASWNALHPDEPIPRMLVVVDEFQELFVEDDKLSGQASLILDRIVRQGRSFGVHAVLSSQTLAGSYSLPRTTLGQMAVRIALQCDASDAQIIFSEDNPAAARLKHPGQAVYNDAGGRIEGNQPMQIGWLPKQKQVEWFGEQHQGYRNADATTNLLGRTVVYDGNRAATWSETNANLAIQNAKKEINPDAIWCVAGESVAINPAVVFPMTRQAGRNVLIAGADDSQAASLLDVATYSFVKNANASGARPKIYTIQGAKPTDANALRLPDKWKSLDCEFHASEARDTDTMIADVHAMVQSRVESEGEADQSPVLLNLVQLGRMRTLRKEDDFASFGESTLSPDKQLEEILRDGPSVGIHVMIWAEGYSTVNRWLSRTALREIEIRMLMQMSGNDSTNLIDSIAASKLGEHVMLLFDEATGQEQRFRPFAPDTLDALQDWKDE